MIEFLSKYGVIIVSVASLSLLILTVSDIVKSERRKKKDNERIFVYFAKKNGVVDHTYVSKDSYEANRNKFFKDKNNVSLADQSKENYEKYAVVNKHYVWLNELCAKIVKLDGKSDLIVYCDQQLKKVSWNDVTFSRDLNFNSLENDEQIGQTVYFIESGDVHSGFIIAVTAMETIVKHGDSVKVFPRNEVFFDETQAKNVLELVNNPKISDPHYSYNESLIIKLVAEKANQNE